jgi:outer membrane receptor protein involved in Fe transport
MTMPAHAQAEPADDVTAAETAATDPATDVSSTSDTPATGDIVVTANKRAQSINTVGLTITALSGDTLATQGVRSLSDLAQTVPGLSYAGTDYGTPVFTLRGVGFYDNSIGGYPTTSVYVDEVPLAFPVTTLHANLDLERVEVLKGPQGTLFGQNSTGGAINYIAAKPTNELAAGMDVSIGRFGAGELNGYVSGPITDTLGVRLSGQYGYGNGWQRSTTRDDSLGKRNLLNGRLLVAWEPTPDLKISLNLNGWRDTSDPQAGQLISVIPNFTNPDGTSVVDPGLAAYPFAVSGPRDADWSPDHRPKAKKKQYQAAMRADLNLTDDIVVTGISSYVHYEVDQTLDQDSTSLDGFQYRDTGSVKSFTQELRIAGGETSSFRWVAGANFESSKTFEMTDQTYSDSTVAAITGSLGGSNYTAQEFRNYAFFGNGELDILPNLTLKAGARYTRSKVSGDLCTYDRGDGTTNGAILFLFGLLHPGEPLPTLRIGDCVTLNRANVPELFSDTLKENNVSWRVGVDWKPSNNLLLYANVAKGYKGGSYPIVAAVTYTSYVPVVQESLLDYEAGFKARLFDRRVSLNGAAFYYDYRNKQLLTRRPDILAGLVPALDNIPKSTVKGVELELTATPVEGLRLNAGVTYLDAAIDSYVGTNAGGVTTDFAGTAIPFTPKWQLVGSADYNFPVQGRIRPFIGLSATKRTGTTSIVGSAQGATLLPGYRSAVPLTETYDLPGYALLDLRAGIEAEDGTWRLMIWGKNVTNKYYWQNVTAAFENITRYAGQPATYGLTFSYKFGQ